MYRSPDRMVPKVSNRTSKDKAKAFATRRPSVDCHCSCRHGVPLKERVSPVSYHSIYSGLDRWTVKSNSEQTGLARPNGMPPVAHTQNYQSQSWIEIWDLGWRVFLLRPVTSWWLYHRHIYTAPHPPTLSPHKSCYVCWSEIDVIARIRWNGDM